LAACHASGRIPICLVEGRRKRLAARIARKIVRSALQLYIGRTLGCFPMLPSIRAASRSWLLSAHSRHPGSIACYQSIGHRRPSTR
jgi:hypothetical protein